MSKKPLSFRESWLRGWRVVLMLIVIQIIAWICWFLLLFLPESIRDFAEIVALIVLGPIICHWAFILFYPDYEPQQASPESEATSCVSCQSVIPPDSDTCPKCGWTYKAT